MSQQPYRLPKGGLIDRDAHAPLHLRRAQLSPAIPGDTLASALLANGEHMVARSFKYHRPRGILAAGSEEPAALVEIGADPRPHRSEHARDRAGALRRPEGAAAELLADARLRCRRGRTTCIAPFIPAGFYYKTFKGWPGWMAFEPLIRRAAGLGRAPTLPDPDRYEAVNRHCDVLVVGGGPAGLMAALAAGRSGARVILGEETAELGGTLLSRDPEILTIDGEGAGRLGRRRSRAELEAMPEVTLLTRTTAFGYYSHNFVGLWERVTDHLPAAERPERLPRQRLWRVRAKEVVLAAGSIERPLVFHENDRPGIMLAGSVRTYMHRYGVLPGKRIVVATNNDSGWDAALDMARAGGEVAAVVDLRSEIGAEHLAEAARRGIAIYGNATIVGTEGRHRISRRRRAAAHGGWRRGQPPGARSTATCSPSPAAGRRTWRSSRSRAASSATTTAIEAFRPGRSWQHERSAGAANGFFGMAECFAEGARAGAEAARAAGFDAMPPRIPHGAGERADRAGADPRHPRASLQPAEAQGARLHRPAGRRDDEGPRPRGEGGLPLGRARQALHDRRHGHRPGQGRQPQRLRLPRLGARRDDAGDRHDDLPPALQAGDLRARSPASMSATISRRAAPRRCTTGTARNGAVFEPVGDWLRARAYPQAGESFHDAVQRESKAARTTIGVLDASTLGKIDVRGPDAREFLNRVYTNAWLEARARQGALRADARRGRHGDGRRRHRLPRRRPFSHDHHDGRRGARARQAGGLSPDRVAGPEGLSDHASPSNGRSPRSAGRSATGW